MKSLKSLLQDEHYEVVGVITQPDRPAGRKMLMTPSPVKTLALSHNLRVVSPESLKQNSFILDAIKSWGPEIGIVVAYGQLLSEDFLKIFPLGVVNVHASLLPRWRGASPIQRALEHGDQFTGVSLQKVVKKLDAGDVIGERRVELNSEINALELHDILAGLGADLLHVELMDYIRGNLAPKPQDESFVTYAKKIEKTESRINWSLSAVQIHNKVRGLLFGPGTHFVREGKKIKVLKTKVFSQSGAFHPGRVSALQPEGFVVDCGEGQLEVLEVQPESKGKMSAGDFLRGQGLKVLEVLQ